MKPDTHPVLKQLKLILPNGDVFHTMSTLTTGELYLDVDFRQHHAWKGGTTTVNKSIAQVSKFNKKFAQFLKDKSDKPDDSENPES